MADLTRDDCERCDNGGAPCVCAGIERAYAEWYEQQQMTMRGSSAPLQTADAFRAGAEWALGTSHPKGDAPT